MMTIEGYIDIRKFQPKKGTKYYYFTEIIREGYKADISNPLVGEFIEDIRSTRDYHKVSFLVEDKITDVWYGFEAGNLYLKEAEINNIENNISNFSMCQIS